MRLAERARRGCESKHVATERVVSLGEYSRAVTCPRFVDVNFLRPNRERALGWGRCK